MKKKNIVLLSLTIIVLLVVVAAATYAYFASGQDNYANGNIRLTTNTAGTARVFDATGGAFHLEVTADNMNEAIANNQVIATAESNLIVNFKSGTNNYSETCSYDIAFEWTSTDRYTAHSSANTSSLKEFTIQATLGSGDNITEGTNLIKTEQDIAEVVGNTNPKTLVSGATITNASESTTTVATWHLVAKFYNLSTNQRELANKAYAGIFKVVNVDCGPTPPTAASDIVALAGTIASLKGTTGTDGSGNAWGIVEDHGIRYVGQNPSNWVWFNCSSLTEQNASTCERWRIIGVFNEKYDTNNDGKPDTEGNLVKIIRNDSLGEYAWDYKQKNVGSSTSDYGSNDWSDSQLMMMLNPPEFVNSGYVNESDTTPVHSNTISGDYVVANSINIYRNMGSYFDSIKTAYKPASTSTSGFTSTTEPGATFTRMNSLSQPMIATVKWYLTGTGSYTSNTNGLASHWYNYERNIDNAGAVFNNSRPKIWYGKIGLMYPSDYGYATSGDSSVSGYDRTSCLNKELYSWDSGSYQTYCAWNDWLLYVGATGNTSATKGTATIQWTITPDPSKAFYVLDVFSNGRVDHYRAYGPDGVRPVLSLVAGVRITSGDGSYASPYSLQMN